MQIKLGCDVAEARRESEENLRIRIGLDNVATNVMIADDGAILSTYEQGHPRNVRGG